MFWKYFIVVFLIVASFVSSCRSEGEKEETLSREKMVEVLYDYQVATALGNQSLDSEEQKEALKLKMSVFAKHHITQQDFDRSLAFYSRNSDEMKAIYREMQKKYNIQGTLIENEQKRSDRGGEYDTIMVWNKRFITLNAQLNNRLAISVVPGVKLLEGDELVFRFGLSWQYRQGMAQAEALFMLELEGDSTLAATSPLYSYMTSQELRLRVGERKIKRIGMQVLQKTKWEKDLQLLFLRDIELFNIIPKHREQPEKRIEQASDSIDNAQDTILNGKLSSP